MKKLGSILMASAVAVMVSSTSASADIKKGQKLYLKACKSCHGTGTAGAAMHTQAEWKELFANGGAGMIKAHTGTKAEKKFTGSFFEKNQEDIFDFLHNYAKDSGNVPSCG